MTITTSQPEWISATDTAKLIRKALTKAFPSTRFGVRTSKYAGGASIDVRWTDGPTDDQVQSVTSGFQGSHFDGMIDMAYGTEAWLEDDGSAHLASSPGTEGQRGSHPEVIEDPRSGSARLVRFCADYVMTQRTLSAEFVAEGAQLAEFNGRDDHGSQCRQCGTWMKGDCWTIATIQRDQPRIDFTCSATCAGRIYARHTSRA